MNAYEEVFATIAREVQVLDEQSFSHSDLGVLRPTREMDATRVCHYLWRFLYLHYYACDVQAARVLLEGSELVVGLPDWEDPRLVERVAAANAGRGYFTDGWTVLALDGHSVRVKREGLTLVADPDEIRGDRPLCVGDAVEVRFPPYLRYVQPRWYMLVSDAGLCRPEDGPIVRSYFAVSPDLAPDLVGALMTELNGVGATFQLKVLNHPAAYVRRDPFVLYLHREAWERHRERIADVHDVFAARLRRDGPCFAQELGRGWRVADEPVHEGAPMSFGQHRCLLLAEGLLQAHRDGVADAAGRLRAIAARYHAAGLDLREPYRNAITVPT